MLLHKLYALQGQHYHIEYITNEELIDRIDNFREENPAYKFVYTGEVDGNMEEAEYADELNGLGSRYATPVYFSDIDVIMLCEVHVGKNLPVCGF